MRLPSTRTYISGEADDQELAVAEIDQRAVGRRVGLPQPLEDDARRVGARRREQLPEHDLEQIAADEGFLARCSTSAAYSPGAWSLSGGAACARSSR